MSREEIQRNIQSLSKEKAPCPDFLTNERIIFVEIQLLMNYVFCLIRYLDMHMFPKCSKLVHVRFYQFLKAKPKVILQIIEV